MPERRHQILMDWGLRGAEANCPGAALAVVVDVLSFTTTLSVALDVGADVYPFPWGDESAQEFAGPARCGTRCRAIRGSPGRVRPVRQLVPREPARGRRIQFPVQDRAAFAQRLCTRAFPRPHQPARPRRRLAQPDSRGGLDRRRTGWPGWPRDGDRGGRALGRRFTAPCGRRSVGRGRGDCRSRGDSRLRSQPRGGYGGRSLSRVAASLPAELRRLSAARS